MTHIASGWQLRYDEIWRAIRSERYKYTVKGDNFGATPWQFFDLENDPCEMTNLLESPDHQEELHRHHKLLCDKLIEAKDHFALAPAFGRDGVNIFL